MANYSNNSIYYGRVYRKPYAKVGPYYIVKDIDHPMPYHVYSVGYKENRENIMLACFQYEEDMEIMFNKKIISYG